AKLYSRDENLWHISHEGGPLEDPTFEPEEDMFRWTVAPELAPDRADYVEIGFEEGFPVSLDGARLDAVTLLTTLNGIGSRHGVGRADVVEDRLVGMKSRGVYETPAGTVIRRAHQALESICLDKHTMHYKDFVTVKYAELVYNGMWYTRLREALDAFIQVTQE